MRAALLLMALGACKHVEYAYAHTITGTVLDGGSRPVANAEVARLSESGIAMGSLYTTTTDAKGHFAFEYHGLAGEEQHGTAHWILRARAGADEVSQAVDAPWSCDTAACPGFHVDNVVLHFRSATAWQQRCSKAFEAMREAAAAIEPELRTAAVELDDVREQVAFSAGPPIQHIAAVHVFVVHDPKAATDWQRRAEALGGGVHVMLVRSSGTYDASIMLDGWDPKRAERLEPVLMKGVEACF